MCTLSKGLPSESLPSHRSLSVVVVAFRCPCEDARAPSYSNIYTKHPSSKLCNNFQLLRAKTSVQHRTTADAFRIKPHTASNRFHTQSRLCCYLPTCRANCCSQNKNTSQRTAGIGIWDTRVTYLFCILFHSNIVVAFMHLHRASLCTKLCYLNNK